MHVFPQLRKLEQKYERELAVVGVHSAKFVAEKDTANLRKAVLRYEIEHPVVNDADFAIWGEYTVRAWPTLMFIDPEGKVIGKHEGEITFDVFDRIIGEMVSELDAAGLIDRRALPSRLERDKEWERPLSFPGKVLADAPGRRVFVADSNHNRIVVADMSGKVEAVIGSGEKGLADGPFARSAFNDPQGMALDGGTLYVADTKNHAIRAVDLEDRTVSTIAGTGDKAMMFHAGGGGLGVQLNSPWDLALEDGALFIAMAGFHQLWRLDLSTGDARPHAGSGREAIGDGPLAMAQLAQPSGITVSGGRLFFTDSETSAVRSASVSGDGDVSTIVGQHLFTFGDVDGVGDEVRLQHPLGIDAHDGALLIADTYNNKIKRIEPGARRAESILGGGKAGHDDGAGPAVRFHEPGGLSAANGRVYVADTNNHAIRVADIESRRVETLELTGV